MPEGLIRGIKAFLFITRRLPASCEVEDHGADVGRHCHRQDPCEDGGTRSLLSGGHLSQGW